MKKTASSTRLRSVREFEMYVRHLRARAEAFARSVKLPCDDVQVSIRRRIRAGYSLRNAELSCDPFGDETVSTVVVHDGQRVGVSTCEGDDADAWFQAAQEARQRLGDAEHDRRLVAPSYRTPPVTFDPDLAEFALSDARFGELASALLDNTQHEVERSGAEVAVGGHVRYQCEFTVIADRAETQHAIMGGLTSRIDFDDNFGEEVLQVHAPESFLPLALLGARSWRNRPVSSIAGDDLPMGPAVDVILHPRVTEALLRAAGPKFWWPAAGVAKPGSQIAHPNVSLVDDPQQNGLLTSRAFDDGGHPTNRTVLIRRGRLLVPPPPPGSSRSANGHYWNRGGGISPGFSSLIMERGERGFHELIRERGRLLLVNQVTNIRHNGEGGFSADISRAVWVRTDGPNARIPSDALQLAGRLFSLQSGQGSLLGSLELSRELHDTGTAILPYAAGTLNISRK